ncbi:MAG TPA: MFS transporter [Acidobacteriota bacterium]|nr:MFS transporter [Acidobacteriota bacterium]
MTSRPPIGSNVRKLGVVSLLTDLSSEMLYAVIPLYLTDVLGAPISIVGLIEGAAESTASALKAISGWLSDRTGRRRPFALAGYALSAIAKPLLALAGSWTWVLGARLIDRTGKGLRGPARDALIADSTAPEQRGRAFGFHRAMDTVGAVIGPLVGLVALSAFGLGYTGLFLLAAVPAVAGVAVLSGVKEIRAPLPASGTTGTGAGVSPELLRFLVVIGVFAIGNSSNVFLLLRARDLGWSQEGVLGLYVIYNLTYAVAALPAGSLSDRIGRRRVLLCGFALSGLVYAGFAIADDGLYAIPLLAGYGLYAAAFAGAGRAYVADLAPRGNIATAMGLYQAVTGVLVLAASLIAGALWDRYGAHAPFVFGAIMSMAAACLFLAICREERAR